MQERDPRVDPRPGDRFKVVIPFFGYAEPLLVYERQPLLVGYMMLNDRELATLADFRRLVGDAEIVCYGDRPSPATVIKKGDQP